MPANRDHARKEWTLEEVRCVTAQDILTDWSLSTAAGVLAAAAQPVSPLKVNKK